MGAARWIALALACGAVLFYLMADLLAGALLATPGNRTRVLAVLGQAVGGEVEARAFSAALLPPALRFEDVRVVGVDAGFPVTLDVPRVDVRFSAGSLLAGEGVVGAIAIEAPVLRVVRAAAGGGLPGLPLVSEVRPDDASDPRAVPGLQSLSVNDGEVLCEDRTQSPVRLGRIADVAFSFRDSGDAAPGQVQLSATSEAGGGLAVRGVPDASGRLAWSAELEDFALESLVPCVPLPPDLRGRASGSLSQRNAAGSRSLWVGDFRVEDARFVLRDFEIEGSLGLRFEIDGSLAGQFQIDATRAAVRWGGVYDKQPGKPAQVTGHFAASDEGVDLDEIHLRIGEPFSAVGVRDWRVAARRPNPWRTGERDGFER